MLPRPIFACCVLLLSSACGSGSVPPDAAVLDGAVAMDARALVDAGPAPGPDGGSDGGRDGGSPADAAALDAGSTSDAGADGGSPAGDACVPVSTDPSAIGQICSGGAGCPSGYTCQPFSGFVFMETCQILCSDDCDCPAAHRCVMITDKTSVPWYQCAP